MYVFVLCFWGVTLNGQNYYLKLYPVSTGLGEVWGLEYDRSNIAAAAGYQRDIDILPAPILAFQIENDAGWFWEIGLGGLGIKRSTGVSQYFTGTTGTSPLGTETHQRFEVQLENFYRHNASLKRSVGHAWGFFAALRYGHAEFVPDAARATWYPLEEMETVLSLGVAPRIQANLNKRLHFDFNIPVHLVHVGFTKSVRNNPALTKEQATSNIVEFDLLNRFACRLGLSWRLNKTNRIKSKEQ